MNDAERRLFITRLLLMMSLGLTVSLARYFLRQKRAMESEQVIGDVELFLKVTRLQELVLPEHTTIIKALESGWNNACYRGPLKPVRLVDWIRQNSTDTLNP